MGVEENEEWGGRRAEWELKVPAGSGCCSDRRGSRALRRVSVTWSHGWCPACEGASAKRISAVLPGCLAPKFLAKSSMSFFASESWPSPNRRTVASRRADSAFALLFRSNRPAALALLRDQSEDAYLAAKRQSAKM
jgi:hypothetical protein